MTLSDTLRLSEILEALSEKFEAKQRQANPICHTVKDFNTNCAQLYLLEMITKLAFFLNFFQLNFQFFFGIGTAVLQWRKIIKSEKSEINL